MPLPYLNKHLKSAVNNDVTENLVRWGHVVRGWLYIMVGTLAVGIGIGLTQIRPGKTNALLIASQSSAGKVFLVIIIIGLIGYSLWGLIRLAWPKPWYIRLGYLYSSLSYAWLLWPAFHLLLSQPSAANSDWLLNRLVTPFGRFLVISAGVVGVFSGIAQFIWSYKLDTLKQLKYEKLPKKTVPYFINIARIGLAGRAILISLSGLVLIQAGRYFRRPPAFGLDSVILILSTWPLGKYLISFLGISLISLGVYSVSLVKWLHYDPSHRQ